MRASSPSLNKLFSTFSFFLFDLLLEISPLLSLTKQRRQSKMTLAPPPLDPANFPRDAADADVVFATFFVSPGW